MRARSTLLPPFTLSLSATLRLMNSFLSNFAAGSTPFLALLFVNLLIISPVHAQKNRIFQWQFVTQPSSIPSCQSLPIVVKPFNSSITSLGVPPYYMISYEIGGTPRVQLIGQNASNLAWQSEHPIGTTLLLDVVDSEGTTGGIPPNNFTVVSGQSQNCISGQDQTDFTVRANLTTSVETCAPWGLRIKGGVPPYNITFLQTNSPVVTNVTMGPNDDAYTYINRADINQILVAAVNDITGRYAFGTPSVMPYGSTNVDCVGLISQPGNAAQLDQQAADARAAAEAKARRKRTAIIAGTVVPITVLLIAGIAAWYYFYYRPRRNRPREMFDLGPDTTVKPYVESGQVLSINSFISDSATTSPRSPKSPPGLHGGSVVRPATHAISPSDAPFDPYNMSDSATGSAVRPSSSGSGGSTRRPGFANFPVRRSVKAVEAGVSPSTNIDPHNLHSAVSETSYDQHSYMATASGSVVNSSGAPPRLPTRTTSVGTTAAGEPELIIQHRDGGPGRVRELPPPYADQYQRNS
ncbi:hypothetical protein Moror_16526 [Moniliophthora roreri MCA 2997]|uniref:Uncharacterized protein n=1 Tax=Moniliophthora roreri (strain MCA 2997) TaxID=1381753 RepID=V2XE91_MONRO|nr:hypothetical protein Moror_16526 [Moniliophthora roreri MCA 2997]